MSEITAALRQSFELFFVEAFTRTHTGRELKFDPYLRYVVSIYENLKERDRLVINQPPRTLKSWTARYFAAWYLGRHPGANVMMISNTQELAEANAYEIRKILKAKWFHKIFPETEISADRSSVNNFQTTCGGGLSAFSVESSLAGFGADLLMIDDPNKIGDALRSDQLRKVNNKYDGEIYSRLNDKKKSIVVVLQHRLSENDLSGHLIAQDYKAVVLPLIAPKSQIYKLPNGKVWHRKRGDLLTRTLGREDVDQARSVLSPPFFWFQQQGADASENDCIKSEDFQLSREPILVGPAVISIDTAQAQGTSNSFNVAQVWQTTHDGLHHLVKQLRMQCGFVEFEKEVARLISRTRPAAVLIENAANGSALLSRLRNKFPETKFISVTPRKSKLQRLNPHRRLIRSGKISLPEGEYWTAAFIEEFTAFSSTFTDQVDATTQYLDFIVTSPVLKQAPQSTGIAVSLASSRPLGAASTLQREGQGTRQLGYAISRASLFRRR